MNKVSPYTKALVAAAVALIGGIAVGYTDDTLTKGELWAAIAAGVTALGVTFGVPNAGHDVDTWAEDPDNLTHGDE